MKNLLAIGCLLIMLFLSACGAAAPGSDLADPSGAPEKTETPTTVSPSAPPENTMPPAAEPAVPAPNPENAAGETFQAEAAPPEAASPVQEAAPSAPPAENPPVQAPEQNQQSASGPFTGVMGTEFVVPEGFIQLSDQPGIGYRYTFWHPDREIRIEVSEIASGYLPEGAWEIDRKNASDNPDVTYFKEGEGWFVDSGYQNNGEEIFYEKEASADGGLKSFRITYPTAKREYGDSITAEFEQNCRF